MKRTMAILLAMGMVILMGGAAPMTDGEIALKTLDDRVAQMMAEPAFNSQAPARQSWPRAYENFYSGYDRLKSKVKLPDEQEVYELRKEFIYPMYHVALWNRNEAAQNMATLDRMSRSDLSIKEFLSLQWDIPYYGVLLDYVTPPEGAADPFYGEGIMWVDETKLKWGGAEHFAVGEYAGRHSLTVTEGMENQLLAMGFRPESATAFSVNISGMGMFICFVDGENYAFYHCNDLNLDLVSSVAGMDLRDILTPGFLYSREEIGMLGKQFASKTENQPDLNPSTGKPVIYLYPERPTDVSVTLGYPAENYTYTYPAYDGGWEVTAYPDGRLVNKADGSEHFYLFWEGDKRVDWDFSEGFVVKGSEAEAFLRKWLPHMGLTPREYNDFITYWVPELARNPYNLITFSTEQYEALAPLTVTPAPDSVLRVHMVFKAIERPVDIPAQVPPSFERSGFAVVEWGGTRA